MSGPPPSSHASRSRFACATFSVPAFAVHLTSGAGPSTVSTRPWGFLIMTPARPTPTTSGARRIVAAERPATDLPAYSKRLAKSRHWVDTATVSVDALAASLAAGPGRDGTPRSPSR